jgi:hypothetical protein
MAQKCLLTSRRFIVKVASRIEENMKTIITALLLLAGAHSALGAMTEKTSAEKLKTLCDVWVANPDGPPKLRELTKDAIDTAFRTQAYMDRCQAFINGMSNEMIGELTWRDDTHKAVIIGNWEDGVTVKQEILIFVDFVNQNPALLNKPANVVFRQSVEAANIYTYAPAQ